MINVWFNNDVANKLTANHRMVIVDSSGEGHFLMKYLPEEYKILIVRNEWDEIAARYKAETEGQDSNVIFYSQKKIDELTFILEYAKTGGWIDISDMEYYIREQLKTYCKTDTVLDKSKLLVAAKSSYGKDEKWWKAVANGNIEPVEIESMLLNFLNNPQKVTSETDPEIMKMFETEVHDLIGLPNVPQKPEALAKEVANHIFNGLLKGSITNKLLHIYYKWTDSIPSKNALSHYISGFNIPSNTDILHSHPNHCFEDLDRKMVSDISKRIENGKELDDYCLYIKNRSSEKASAYKPQWLSELLLLLTFDNSGINAVSNLNSFCKYYQTVFAPLDTAMRKLYVAFLNEKQTLRPLQHLYDQFNKELLGKWFELNGNYKSEQLGLLKKCFSENARVAIIVCDGLRLEIANRIVDNLEAEQANCEIEKNYAFSMLPSVTDICMSALYGSEEVVDKQVRQNILKKEIADIEFLELDSLNNGITTRNLVLLFGDIDQVGEKKQMAGLKDIDQYEQLLLQKIKQLLSMGYEKVYLTTDHGFVITGIMDEADKISVPSYGPLNVNERFLLSNTRLDANYLIEKPSKYYGCCYEYYAKTDKPFVSKGSYGYAHGGFSPQECIIPFYKFTKESSSIERMNVGIINKDELKSVPGNLFTIKIKGEGNEKDLFTSERKIKCVLYSKKATGQSPILTIYANKVTSIEYTFEEDEYKIVIIDAETTQQLDYCIVKKEKTRDLGGLL